MRRWRIFFAGFVTFLSVPGSVFAQSTASNWYMAGGNPARTSWNATAPSGINGVTWYRPIEAYIDQKTQLITANGKVYVTTTGGLVVLDAETGQLKWRFDTQMPLGNSPTVVGDVVYVGGMDRKVYALRDLGDSYQMVWEFSGSAAGFSVNPVVVNNRVYIGSRDGTFYALNSGTGQVVWTYETGGPILYSAAYDNFDNSLYIASSDMYAYKLNAATGSLTWKSAKLPGEVYQSWWPVIYDQYVIFSGAPGYKNGTNPGTLSVGVGLNIKDMFRESFFEDSTGGTGAIATAADSVVWPTGSRILDSLSNPGLPNTLGSYFERYPQYKVMIALDKSDGRETVVLPFIYSGTFSGNVYPPVVNPNTNGLYANNLSSLTAGNSIARVQLMGWKPNSRFLHLPANINWAVDEPMAYSGAGSTTYFSLCCDRAAGIVGGTAWWNYGPNPGLLDNVLPSTGDAKYDPMWRKYGNALERLMAYYKGNTDSRSGVYNSHGLQNPLVPYVFTNAAGQTVQRLFIHRSNSVIALGTTASETFLPLVAKNNNPAVSGSVLSEVQLRQKLDEQVNKIIDAGWLSPGYHNNGTGIPGSIGVSNFYFENPGDTLGTLSSSYPYVSASVQARLGSYLQNFFARYYGGVIVNSLGWTNGSRSHMSFPPEVQTAMNTRTDLTSGAFAQRNFYSLYAYARVFPTAALNIYNTFRPRLVVPSNLTDDTLLRTPHVFNEYIAGYTGFLGLQQLAYGGNYPADVQTLRNSVTNELNNLMSRRSSRFAIEHPWLGELDNPTGIQINSYSRQFNVARNFLYMTPELGAYLRQNNPTVMSQAVSLYTYLAPFWFSANTDNAFQEGIKTHLYDSPALFSAKAYVMGESRPELSKYIDVPNFAVGDLFFMQNLTAALSAGSQTPVFPTGVPTTPTVPTTTVPPVATATAAPTPTVAPIGSSAVKKINVPDFGADVVRFARSALFWFGSVDNTNNYTDVRMGFNDAGVSARAQVFDSRLWYQTTGANPANLEQYDSLALYITHPGGEYKIITGPSHGTTRTGYQAIYRRVTGNWALQTSSLTTRSGWRGNAFNDNVEDRGWWVEMDIPYASIGLSAKPAVGTSFDMTAELFDRDTNTAGLIPSKTWVGKLVFGAPTYNSGGTPRTGNTTITTGMDAQVGGGANCSEGLQPYFDNVGSKIWGNVTQINIQNQMDVADWPCYSKYYAKFGLESVPAGKTIISATFKLHQFGNAGDITHVPPYVPHDSQIHAFSIKDDWNESTINLNNAPAALENVSVTTVTPIWDETGNTFAGWPGREISFDVSAAVAAAYAEGRSANLALYSSDGDYHSGKYFSTFDTENWNAAARPKLEIVWGETGGVRVGDANSDGLVNNIDYEVWLTNYGRPTSEQARAGDFDNNGTVDGIDYVLWLKNYDN